ncbi:MAG: DNA-directed RNA polymerase subunit beta [Clostridia bacterium]|nr:DNA-directed RNA polymerase subunit beta [Clostridia bacterium]
MIHLNDQKLGENTRRSFSRTRFNLELPDLLEVQTRSYKWFLEEGLTEVLHEVSPITDFSGNLQIEFISYTLSDKPNYPVEECKERDVNYAASLKVRVRLTNKQTGEVHDADIFMGEFPLMTETGTFVINGAERVIVSQIVRSPGMYYASEIDKTGKKLYSAQIIPYRGAWLEYETDINGVMFVRIDKTRKVPITMFIRALGALGVDKETADLNAREDVYRLLGEEDRLKITFEKDECENLASANHTTPNVEALKEIYKKLRPGEPPLVESAEILLNNYFFDPKRYDIAPVGRYKFDKKMAISARIAGHTAAADVVSPLTGEVVCEAGTFITTDLARTIEQAGVIGMDVTAEDGAAVRVLSNNTLEPEYIIGIDLHDCGVKEKVRTAVLQQMMEECGGDLDELKRRVKLDLTSGESRLVPKHITKDDIFASISYMLNLTHDVGSVDDIDHLGNRRIRSVGEQLQNQFRIGFVRMEKIIKERMTTQDNDKLTPQALINIRPVVTAIREFFGSSQLSQFADQNNPLAELTHRRRLSALGPGGLSRDRASFDVRDVHYTQYGRMCPIETPEGPNIGLISYLTTYAHISDYGFIEAPYRKVKHVYDDNGKLIDQYVTDEVVYMTADVEDNYIVAQANEPLDETGHFLNKKVTARERTEIGTFDASKVDLMDVSPKMVVSVATAMIPFLENDDNTRALMGANMQKQAVPLMVTDAPIVGTGMEYKAAVDSGVVVVARRAGRVERVEADKITIVTDDGQKDTYTLRKFKRTNQGTCFNQRPIVRRDQQIKAGQVIADGPATSKGEVSLGKNALIGFMTWEGYNYEDAVLLNERLVRDDVYTSLHIEEYSHEARDTKLGPEEITREIPNVGDDVLKDLNADGIVKKGTEVRAGDILVGKITPKGETELTAEERLLRAIFGEKAREVRDTSLRLPHGESGVVVDVRVFSREQGDDLPASVNKVVKVYIAQKRKISVGDKMAGRHGNKGVVSRILPPEDMPFLPDGTPLDIVLNPLGVPSRMNIGQVLEVHLGIASRKLGWKIMTPVFDGANEKDISECLQMAGYNRPLFAGENPEGKDLYEMMKDENGNKLLDEDGKPVFRLLTPEQRSDPAYIESLRQADTLRLFDGKTILYDGRTGEPFDNPVTVGIMYYLKLHHLVDDKIHARSNGPYSLVTQQPLGGKAQFGGQRFGEMEVWALEAYGAAYTLQEILTVKSDDIVGRRKAYEAIIKGQNIPTPGVPESFKVMVKELQALALDIRVLNKDGEEVDLSTLCQEDDQPTYRRRVPRTMEDDDVERATGTYVAPDDLTDSMLIDHSDSDPDEEYDENADYGAESDADDGFDSDN